MKLIRQGIIHCAYVALLVESSACMGSTDSQGLPGQVEAAGEAQDLRASKHKRKKHKLHYDKCEPVKCESVELQVDSHKHREATRDLDGSIRVQIPQSLPALYWGAELHAELAFQQGDTRVVCSYGAQSRKGRHLFRALELEVCDNGAKASDIITIDSAKLELECSSWTELAKVHVKLHEVEPCGESACDPAAIDDGDPCTVDACDPDGGVTHTPAADGTSCDDGNVCNGHECCQAGNCVGASSGPIQCGGAEDRLVFSTDFEGNTPPAEVLPGIATLTPVQGYAGLGTDPRKFAGNFLWSPTGNRVTLQLSGLPQHDRLNVRFLFAAIDSLDGTGSFPAGENFVVRVDDVVIFEESFANARTYQVQTYVPAPGVELARRVPLGFEVGSDYTDSAYDLGKEPAFLGIVHSTATATISWEYVGPGIQPLESWAMDNLEVSVSGSVACEDCGQTPPVVDDNNPCTSDSCDPVLGVRHEPVTAGTRCGDDNNVCDGSPTCDAQGMCVSGTPLNCDDGNACNGTERCDAAMGCRSGTPLACDDANVCNGVEQCDAAAGCRSGTPPIVNDTDPCTVGVCDPSSGVSQVPAPVGTPCGPDAACDGAGNCEEFN